MYLSKFTYRDDNWEIGPICFAEQSLIVGPNASGKSTVLRCIRDFVRIVSERYKIESVHNCDYLLEFNNSIGQVAYSLSILDGKVEKERLEMNGTVRVLRESGRSFVGEEPVNVPDTTLVLKARRDIDKYPDIELVLSWVDQLSSFIFSNILSSNREVSPFTSSNVNICWMWERLSRSGKKAVMDWMRELRYKIDAIDLADNQLGEKSLFVIERDVKGPVIMGKMSNGMFRVLYLLVYLQYVAEHSTGFVLIDDLGEGLDFFRSSALGKELFAFGKEHGIQLIVTSNDNFLVDTVDLSSWVLLKRTGSVVSSVSEMTNPNEFARFRRMGLSNFDLLKTDYLVRYFD